MDYQVAIARRSPSYVEFVVSGLLGRAPVAREIERRLAARGMPGARASARTGRLRIPGGAFRDDAKVEALLRETLEDSAPQEHAFHAMPAAAILAALAASPDGLASAEAKRRLARDGPNRIEDVRGRSAAEILLEQFRSVPVALLGGSGAIALATRAYADAGAIAAVLGVNGAIGFSMERQAEETVASLRRIAPRVASVLRDGRQTRIDSGEIVAGDVLLLKPGEPVAADARLLESHRLAVNEATLTGESLPVHKNAVDAVAALAPIADRTDMVYMGTVVTGGVGKALVVATGERTALGHIRALAQLAEAPRTRLQLELDELGKRLGIGAVLLCAGVLGLGLLRGRALLPMLRTAISLGVAAIPEGLPTVATSLLAKSVRSLRERHVYARRLDAIENLGAIDVIALDKTGTLTENRMRLARVAFAGRIHEIVDGALHAVKQALPPEWHLVATLCNDVVRENGALSGSSTETALVEFSERCGHRLLDLRRAHRLLEVKHRSEHHPYMVTLHVHRERGALVAIKGRPDEVLERCVSWHDGARAQPLTRRQRRAILAQNLRLAGSGHRVLGLAFRTQRERRLGETGGLVWLGLAALADTMRPGLPDMFERFRRAGIRPLMITGDQLGTAEAVASRIGLDGPGAIVDASGLPESPETLGGVIADARGFARTSPAMKLDIVRALQRQGHVVGMTGDGINDGPALKSADVGIAMGVTGTDFARAMSDLVLRDDHPAAILPAIAEGRTAYANIRKSVKYLAATNISELATATLAVAAGLPDPLEPLALLWINLVTDIWPAIEIGLEPPEPDVLDRPPVRLASGVLDRGDWRRVLVDGGVMTAATMTGFLYGIARYGRSPRASTVAFTTITAAQLVYALSASSERRIGSRTGGNARLLRAIGASLAAQAAVLVVPRLRALLRTAPIGLADIVVAGGLALLPTIAAEIRKPGNAPRRNVEPRSGRP
jgi:Ca2+-transporting ATPase